MTPRWNLLLSGALFVIGCLWLAKVLISGMPQYSFLPVLGVVALLVAMLTVKLRPYWLGIMLSGGLITISLPIPILDRITVGLALQLLIALLLVGERGMRLGAGNKIPFSIADKLILLSGMVVVGRLIYDHPGSARMGGTGGLGNAVYFSMAFLLFFVTRDLALGKFEYKKIIHCLMLLAALGCLYNVVISIGEIPIYYGKYEYGMWLLAPFALAWTLATPMTWLKRNTLILVIVFGSLGLAMLGPFRSRIYFALASMLAVAWCFRAYWRLLWLMLGGGLAAVIVVMNLPHEKIPAAIVRPVSTLVNVDPRALAAAQEKYVMSSETGWSSEFRRLLFESALRQIKQHPVLGIGWKFSFEEIMTAVNIGGFATGGLEVAGDYHDLFLTVAVKCGLPAMLMLVVGLILIMGRFIIWIRKHGRGLPRSELILLASLLGYWCASLGQGLMNGGGADLINILISTAIFSVVPRLPRSEPAIATIPTSIAPAPSGIRV